MSATASPFAPQTQQLGFTGLGTSTTFPSQLPTQTFGTTTTSTVQPFTFATSPTSTLQPQQGFTFAAAPQQQPTLTQQGGLFTTAGTLPTTTQGQQQQGIVPTTTTTAMQQQQPTLFTAQLAPSPRPATTQAAIFTAGVPPQGTSQQPTQRRTPTPRQPTPQEATSPRVQYPEAPSPQAPLTLSPIIGNLQAIRAQRDTEAFYNAIAQALPALRDPISMELMINPVIASSGLTYDFDSLSQNVQRGSGLIDPMTNEPISRYVLPNRVVRQVIEQLIQSLGVNIPLPQYRADLWGNNVVGDLITGRVVRGTPDARVTIQVGGGGAAVAAAPVAVAPARGPAAPVSPVPVQVPFGGPRRARDNIEAARNSLPANVNVRPITTITYCRRPFNQIADPQTGVTFTAGNDVFELALYNTLPSTFIVTNTDPTFADVNNRIAVQQDLSADRLPAGFLRRLGFRANQTPTPAQIIDNISPRILYEDSPDVLNYPDLPQFYDTVDALYQWIDRYGSEIGIPARNDPQGNTFPQGFRDLLVSRLLENIIDTVYFQCDQRTL